MPTKKQRGKKQPTPPKRGRGRPRVHDRQAVTEQICKRISEGEYLPAITADRGMPTIWTVMEWLREMPEFAQAYARAREARADGLVDELLRIADEIPADATEAASLRLRVDTRKWLAARLAPRHYGDRMELSGDPERPVVPPVPPAFLIVAGKAGKGRG